MNRNQFIKNGISQRKKFAIQMICSSMKIWGLWERIHGLYCVRSIVRVAKQWDEYATKSEKLTRFNGEKHTIVPAMLLISWQTNEKNCVCGLKPFAGQRNAPISRTYSIRFRFCITLFIDLVFSCFVLAKFCVHLYICVCLPTI